MARAATGSDRDSKLLLQHASTSPNRSLGPQHAPPVAPITCDHRQVLSDNSTPTARATMSTHDIFNALLRPAVLDILRAAGFNGAKPSVVDTVVDLTARYLTLLASRTAYNAFSNHNDLEPDVTDVRMAMQDCGLLVPTLTAAEELWKEILRKPLEEYDDAGARAEEERRRDREDTADVTAFIDWVTGKQNEEIMRIAGTLKSKPEPGVTLTEQEERDKQEMEDYLTCTLDHCIATMSRADFASSTYEEA